MRAPIFIFIIALMLSSFAAASSVYVPSGIYNYSPVVLTNSQSSAFTSNSQIMLTVNSLAYMPYEANNLQNVEFFYANGTIIPSWLEGNLLNELQTANLYTSTDNIYWLRVSNAQNFLSGSATNDIYIGFAPTNTNLMSNTVTGEAPQLSPYYAEYDDGANVFANYWNFAGQSLPSAFSESVNYGTVTTSNGLTINSVTDNSIFVYYDTELNPAGLLADAMFKNGTATSDGHDELLGWDTGTPAAGVSNSGWWGWENGVTVGVHNTEEIVVIYEGDSTATSFSSFNYPIIVTNDWQSSDTNYGIFDYGNPQLSLAAETPDIGDSYLSLFVSDGGGFSTTWMRTRLYPPGDTMPSASFGNVYSTPTISLANSLSSNSIDLVAGSASDNALITGTCATGDTCDIYASNGIALASGTTTVRLAYNSLPLGYTILYTNDITGGAVSGNVYVRRIYEANSLRLTFTNSQPFAEQGNASVIVAFNALAYQSIEANNLDNTAIAFKNGTVAYSWLEGNVLGEENIANDLIDSQNVTYWFKAPPSNAFLGPDMGSVVTNSVFLVFGLTSDNLLDGNFIGEAPQLSCPQGTPSTCVGGTYAEYDNGKSIFTYYTNFAGTSMPLGWDTSETASLVVDNGISFTGAGTGGAEAQVTMNTAYDRPISLDVLSEVEGSNPVYDLGYVNTKGVFSSGYQVSGAATSQFNVYVDSPGSTPRNTQPVATGTAVASIWNVVTLGIGSESLHDEVAYVPFSSYNGTQYDDFYPMFGSWWNDKSVYAQWFRLRSAYDSNVSLAAPLVTQPNAYSPTISLANSTTASSIGIIAGSASDNALITARCYPGDTCQIYSSNGISLASNTTVVRIAYNSLPIGQTYLYANDITAGLASNEVYVYRIVSTNSIAITLENSQDSPVEPNSQLMITLNAANYTSWEASNLDNTVIYFQNGTVAFSWLQGNVLNEATPANSLIDSSSVAYWFRTPGGTSFLPADVGTVTSNTVHMGFDVPTNDLIEGKIIGEAPWLSSTYGRYDNGNNVFDLYFNMTSNPISYSDLGSQYWSTVSGTGPYGNTQSLLQWNGITLQEFATTPSSTSQFQSNFIVDEFVKTNGAGYDVGIGASTASGAANGYAADPGGSFNTRFYLWKVVSSAFSTLTFNNYVQSAISWYTTEFEYQSNGLISGYTQAGANNLDISNSSSVVSDVDSTFSSFNSILLIPYASTSTSSTEYSLLLARSLPPLGVMPAASFLPGHSLPANMTGLSPASQAVAQGQSAIISDDGISGGTGPYAYQWYESANSTPTATSENAVNANDILGTGSGNGQAQSQNAIFVTNSMIPVGTYSFVLYGYDSNFATVNSTAANVTVTTPPSQSSGGSAPAFHTTLLDNINSGAQSSSPVITATLDGSSASYYQNQLPVTLTGRGVSLVFACSVNIGEDTYVFANDAYGIGTGLQCGNAYYTTGANITAIYSLSENSTVKTTTSITSTTVSTTTILATTIAVPKTTIINSTQKGFSNESAPIQFPGASISLMSGNNSHLSVIIANVSSSLTYGLPEFERISAFNVSIEGNTTPIAGPIVNLTLDYPCSYNSSSVDPYLLHNGTWETIQNYTIDAQSCGISIPVSRNSTVALFFKAPIAPTVPVEVASNASGPTAVEEVIIAGAATIAVVAVAGKLWLAKLLKAKKTVHKGKK